MMRTWYHVKSELNPQYELTGDPKDYYGIYHVIEYKSDGSKRIVKTFADVWTGLDFRHEAYKLARKLNDEKT